MNKTQDAEGIVRSHVVWSMGAGLMPIPLFDIAAVTAVQMDMLKQLAELFEVEYSTSGGKGFVSALAGGTVARIGASAVKMIPGIGTVIGGVSMSVMSGASTYAVGQVAVTHFGSKADLMDIDLDWAKKAYSELFEKGKEVVSDLKDKETESKDVYESLEKLGRLKEQGVVTDAEFEAQKHKLLERL
jgi:uncharacterized protein (DUF697 family)